MQQIIQHEPAPTSSRSVLNIAAWLDLMRTTDKLLLAGLRRKVGPEGDVQEAYRRWYADHMREHDDAVRHMLSRLRGGDRERPDAR